MLQAFLLPILPVFLIAGLGAFLSRKTDWLDNPALGAMITNIGLPALLIHSLLKMQMDVAGMGQLILAMALTLALVALLTLGALKLTGQPVRQYLAVLVNPNTGNLGIPVVYALLGDEALALAVVVSSVVTISHFTLGVSVMSGSFAPRQMLRNAPAIALIVAALLLAFDLPLPAVAMKTLEMLGGITLPIMLLLLGRSLGGLRFNRATHWPRLLTMACWRPLVGVGGALAIGTLLGLEPLALHTLLIQNAMPVAVISYILTTRYQGPSDEVAGLIVLTLPTSLAMVAALTLLWG
jgi:predicted permease